MLGGSLSCTCLAASKIKLRHLNFTSLSCSAFSLDAAISTNALSVITTSNKIIFAGKTRISPNNTQAAGKIYQRLGEKRSPNPLIISGTGHPATVLERTTSIRLISSMQRSIFSGSACSSREITTTSELAPEKINLYCVHLTHTMSISVPITLRCTWAASSP